jgi:hypothetical protein
VAGVQGGSSFCRETQTGASTNKAYTFICNPLTLANASPMPSQTVGCA